MDTRNSLYDSGDNGNLQEKLDSMRLDLTILKKKLYLEKALLTKQHHESIQTYGLKPFHNELSKKKSGEECIRSRPAIWVNKAYLRDIERKCNTELEKLSDYVFNINQLRSSWIKMREAQRLNSANRKNPEKEIPSVSLPRQYLKGKVFYVDREEDTDWTKTRYSDLC